MEPLLLGASLLAGTIQMSKNNRIGIVKDCDIHDEICSLYGNVPVDTFGFGP